MPSTVDRLKARRPSSYAGGGRVMYITAHHVASPTSNRDGINSFLHLHGAMPGMNWNAPNVRLVSDRIPGTLVRQQQEIEPGGNHVLSYLDVVAPDSAGMAQVEAALAQFGNELAGRDLPVSRVIN